MHAFQRSRAVDSEIRTKAQMADQFSRRSQVRDKGLDGTQTETQVDDHWTVIRLSVGRLCGLR